jgi:hypothetical protein
MARTLCAAGLDVNSIYITQSSCQRKKKNSSAKTYLTTAPLFLLSFFLFHTSSSAITMTSRQQRKRAAVTCSITAFNRPIPRSVEKYILTFLCPSSLGIMLDTTREMRSLVNASLHSRQEIFLSCEDGSVSYEERRLWSALLQSSGNLRRIMVRGIPGVVDFVGCDNDLNEDKNLELLGDIIRANASSLEILSLGETPLEPVTDVLYTLPKDFCDLVAHQCPKMQRFSCPGAVLPFPIAVGESGIVPNDITSATTISFLESNRRFSGGSCCFILVQNI